MPEQPAGTTVINTTLTRMAGIRGSDVVVALLLCVASQAVTSNTYTERLQKAMLEKAQNETLRLLLKQYAPRYSGNDAVNADVPPFHCDPLAKSATNPTSVHALRPGDIKVIGAMGDSLTAGTGISARWILEELIENRGLTWSGGGQGTYKDHLTVPNILKHYEPQLVGYATGNGDENSKNAQFNVAVAGSVSGDLTAQARELVERMRNDPRVDIENDWKLVTILSGNNDLCDYCKDSRYTAEAYKSNVIAALDILHAELPRTLVNLVEPLNMEIVIELNKGILCSALHFFLCECAAFPDNDEKEKEVIRIADEYQRLTDEIALSGRYDTREDFTVVCQPFFNQTYVPYSGNGEPDLSYFAPDCFHLSEKGQEAAASALWNNMVEPVHFKRTEWTPGELIECPTEEKPYIYTNKNSGGSQKFARTQTSDDKVDGSTQLLVVGVVSGVTVFAITVAVIVGIRRRQRRLYVQL